MYEKMKKSLQFLILSFVFISITQFANAQYVIKEADQQYELFNYNKAINLYEQAYKKKNTLHAAERLAAANKMLGNYVQAESWYATAIRMPESKNENVLNYAKMLQQNAKFSEAKSQYAAYFEKEKNIDEALKSNLLASCDSALIWMKNPKQISINNQDLLNSTQADWGSFSYQNGIVFTSDRENKNINTDRKKPFLKFDGNRLPDKNIYGWTGNAYLKLYWQRGNDSVQLFPLKTNMDYHIGPASFTADGNLMYFTLTRIPDRISGKLSTINIEIYSSSKDGMGVWSTPISFDYNKAKEYSVGDPFITPDGSRLYFVSNMPGGMGGTDIYYVDKESNGKWANPINVKAVNTQGNERTPYLDGAQNLYFSSDFRIGMGGLDIYKLPKNMADSKQIVNLGYPINSPQDDFAFNINSEDGTGYLSSNRFGGVGSDDIYKVAGTNIYAITLTGKVYNKKTNEPVSGALVSLAKINGDFLKVETDENGSFNFKLDKESDFNLSGEKTGYRSQVIHLSTKGLNASETIRKDLFIEPVELNKAIKLENIYYDFDKWAIRDDAAMALDKLVLVLKENPTIWIELGSHTDSRGGEAYNQALSQKRAESAVQYIISKGINRNRITAKGYGESKLLNKCASDISCTDAEHQLNRRTEFTIVKQ